LFWGQFSSIQVWNCAAARPVKEQQISITDVVPGRKCLAAVDDRREFLVVADQTRNVLMVFAFNKEKKVFDAVTEITVHKPILYFCLSPARNPQKEFSQEDVADVGVWCIHPESIQVYYVDSEACRPDRTAGSEPDDSAVTAEPAPYEEIAASESPEASPPSVSPTKSPQNSPVSGVMNVGERMSEPTAPPSALSVQDVALKLRGESAEPSPRKADEQVDASDSDSKAAKKNDLKKKEKKDKHTKPTQPVKVLQRSDPGAPVVAERTPTRSPAPQSKLGVDEKELNANLVKMVEAAVGKLSKSIVQQIDTNRQNRELFKKEFIDDLVEDLGKTVRIVSQRCVEATLDNFLKRTFPVVLERMLRDVLSSAINSSGKTKVAPASSLDARSVVSSAIDGSKLKESLDTARKLMSEQIDASVKSSLESFSASYRASLQQSNASADEVMLEKAKFIEEQARALSGTFRQATAPAVQRVDPKKALNELFEAGDINGMFTLIVKERSEELLSEASTKLELNEIFEDQENVDQLNTLGLCDLIGQNLAEDTSTRLVWLEKLLLNIDPDAEEIEYMYAPIMHGLESELQLLLETLQNDASTTVDQRRCKKLCRLARSLNS